MGCEGCCLICKTDRSASYWTWLDGRSWFFLSFGGRNSASLAVVDTMSVQGLDAPHVLPVFCCVQSSSDETRAAVVKNLGVGGDLELRMLEIVRLG